MEMSPIIVCRVTPVFMRIVIVTIALWPFVTPMAISRRSDLRAFVLGPLVIGALGAALGRFNAEQRAGVSGTHGAAFAAGLAESLLMAMLGAAITALVAIVIAVLPRIDEARRSRTPGIEAVMALAFISAGLVILQRFTIATIVLSCIGTLAVLIAAFIRSASRQPRSGRYAFIGIALASLSVALVLWRIIEHYRAIALGVA